MSEILRAAIVFAFVVFLVSFPPTSAMLARVLAHWETV